jgi:hypothetical protein
MKRDDAVFFFTFIDLLVQIVFFGLLLYALSEAAASKQARELRAVTGTSDLTELTDELTRLVPPNEAKLLIETLRTLPAADAIKRAMDIVQEFGGPAKLREALEKLRRAEEGSGKPPCLFDMVNGKRVPRHIATVVASDAEIRFESVTDDLSEVLRIVGRSVDSVQRLSLEDFKTTFRPVTNRKPECRYWLRFIETTRFVDARDAAYAAFLLKIEKR